MLYLTSIKQLSGLISVAVLGRVSITASNEASPPALIFSQKSPALASAACLPHPLSKVYRTQSPACSMPYPMSATCLLQTHTYTHTQMLTHSNTQTTQTIIHRLIDTLIKERPPPPYIHHKICHQPTLTLILHHLLLFLFLDLNNPDQNAHTHLS